MKNKDGDDQEKKGIGGVLKGIGANLGLITDDSDSVNNSNASVPDSEGESKLTSKVLTSFSATPGNNPLAAEADDIVGGKKSEDLVIKMREQIYAYLDDQTQPGVEAFKLFLSTIAELKEDITDKFRLYTKALSILSKSHKDFSGLNLAQSANTYKSNLSGVKSEFGSSILNMENDLDKKSEDLRGIDGQIDQIKQEISKLEANVNRLARKKKTLGQDIALRQEELLIKRSSFADSYDQISKELEEIVSSINQYLVRSKNGK